MVNLSLRVLCQSLTISRGVKVGGKSEYGERWPMWK